MYLNNFKPAKEDRANMSKDEMLRALWLLDDYVESFGWHLVSVDGLPGPNKYGYWCKKSNGEYDRLWFQDGFYRYSGCRRIYIQENSVVAWQRLNELSVY